MNSVQITLRYRNQETLTSARSFAEIFRDDDVSFNFKEEYQQATREDLKLYA